MIDENPKIFSIIGDSTAMVRPDDGLLERDLYSCKLQQKLGCEYYVINKAKVGNYAARSVSDESIVYNIRGANAQYFSIQIGIVDCAPRLFTENERRRLAKFVNYPFLGGFFKAYIQRQSIQRYKKTQNRRIVLTPTYEFETYYRELVEKIRFFNPVQAIYVLNIAYPGPYFLERNYGIDENIRAFNEILQKIVCDNSDLLKLVDVYSFTMNNPKYILSDGHHFSSEVHTFIAEELYRCVSELTDHDDHR